MLETPVLFLIFNRPDTTARVFEQIKLVKPSHLYVAADGPRENIKTDQDKCHQARHLIINQIDWKCELKTLFRDTNLGCGIAVNQAITWFFEHEERGIILEDDCIPNLSFFSFCTELLEYHAQNEQIMHISGNNFSKQETKQDLSYSYTKYLTVWGWATWRRAWAKYDFNTLFLEDFIKSPQFHEIVLSKNQKQYWLEVFNHVRDKDYNSWDYQWMLACWKNDGLAITPTLNLVSNIGFGEDATHTKRESKTGFVKSYSISHLKHPHLFRRNVKMDNQTFHNYYVISQDLNKLRNVLYKIFPKVVMMRMRWIRRTFFPNMK